jgi:hypothetical protein
MHIRFILLSAIFLVHFNGLKAQVECLADVDCFKKPSTPKCIEGRCGCSQDGDCPPKQVCDQQTHVCKEKKQKSEGDTSPEDSETKTPPSRLSE